MSNYRWGSLARQQRADKDDRGWDWLVGTFDSNRIRATLMQYPVCDTLEPIPEAEKTETANKHADEDLYSEDEEVDDNDDGSSTSSSIIGYKRESSNLSKALCDEWRGNGIDCRYSPGFILPLVLGALEDYMPQELELGAGKESPRNVTIPNEDGGCEDDKESREPQQDFCHFSRRLCDRGAIAFALASLSSRCPSIRKVAFAICGLFLKALQMPESQEIKSWHERPQLEMLMSSVQRGLAVRRAIQIQKAKETQDTRPISTPMLPAVSAVFLAKSLTILSRPGDDMYGPINRYFLRLKDYHGAFQDCFSLPAFLSLYCNSSDDLSRCKIERNWALLALKDGVVDEFCYRIICQSHIPELVMSSLDSSMDNPDCMSEVSLTIDVISSLIKAGSSRAATHMIHRLGILSWLHGIISWREISSVLPSTSLKCKYLRLVGTAVQSYSANNINAETPFFEKVSLANTVVRICLSGYADESRDQQDTNNDESLLKSTCDALWEIYLADKQTSQGGDYICGHTTLDDMTTLLAKFVVYDQMFPKILSSLCSLPIIASNDDSSAQVFCKLALGYITRNENTSELNPKLALLILKRAHELIVKYPQIAKDEVISALVLKCRSLVLLVDKGIQVWDTVMSLVED
jgi:hypothetical protein